MIRDCRETRCSSYIIHQSAFTLIEVLTTLAVLTIIMGLMVSLSRYVRDQSAQTLTRTVLVRLDDLMRQYAQDHDGHIPMVAPLLNARASIAPDAPLVAAAALRNNQQCIRQLMTEYRSLHKELQVAETPFNDLPISVWDERTMTLRDAWGSPVVFMAGQHQLIGLAPSRAGQDQFFFFSAGPDRDYLSREDNVYSYETQSGSEE
ncbi:MAG TPA: type II secretion system protein [Tepidisphaeraceae bacterium]|nr:type II secretion system protein [Tepidisphaeraceae bacterium]